MNMSEEIFADDLVVSFGVICLNRRVRNMSEVVLNYICSVAFHAR